MAGPPRAPKRAETPAQIAAMAVLGLVAVAIAISLSRHWTLSLPVAGLLRLAEWLARGVACSVPVLAAGGLVTWPLRRRGELPGTVAVAAAWGAGWVAVMVTGIVMLAAEIYTEQVWRALAVTGWLVLVGWLVSVRWQPVVALWRSLRSRFQGAPPLISWRSLLIVSAVLAALAASLPPDTRDELSYHLAVPELWHFQGSWWLPADNFHLLFPGNAELCWGWASAVGGPLAPRFLTFAFAVFTVALLAEWLSGSSLPRRVRDLCLVVLLVTPVFLTSAAICYVEWPLLFFLLMGWRLSHLSGAMPWTGASWAVATAWGAACGMKYTAVGFAGLLAAGWLARTWRQRGPARAGLALAALVIAGAVLAGPWLVRNAVATGDPFYPLAGGVGVAGHQSQGAVLANYVQLHGVWRWFPWLYHATADPVADHRLHPLWPLLLIVVVGAGWRWRRELPWLVVVVAAAALLPFSPVPRVELPLMVLVWLFLPRLLAPLEADAEARHVVTATVLVVALVSVPVAAYYLLVMPGRSAPDYLIGLADRETFLRERGLLTPVIQWVRTSTPPDTRVWAWCEDEILYLDRWTRPDSPYGPPAFLTTLRREGPRGLAGALAGYDLVLLNRDRCGPSFEGVTSERRTFTIQPTERAELESVVRRRLSEIMRDQHYILYRVWRRPDAPPPSSGP